MIRRFAIAAALSTASLVVFLPAASAQTYGGVTLSFGSPGYHDLYDRYEQPRYNPYEDQDEAWEARRRWEQHERWERERARQEHWRHEHAEHGRWHRDDDDDD